MKEMRLQALLPIILAAALGQTPARGPASDEMPGIAQRSAGLRHYEGFVPFYWDARRGALLLEIAPGREDFLYGSGLASGAGLLEPILDRGDLGPLGLCRFERVGPKVLLEQRQTVNRSGDPDPERTRAVEESFAFSVLAAMPVVAEQDGTVLADATEFLLRDSGVAAAFRAARQGEWRQDAARSALNFDRTGAFPRNTEIEAVLTFTSENPPAAVAEALPDGRTLSLRVHHTFLKLPEPGFRPRRADPRVGFIPLFRRDPTAPFTEPIERFLVSRWRLDASHPLVYYIDRGIPEPERTAVREAALWWNHAFAEAGFPGALEVRDLPEGATFLDARYSGVEWVDRVERSWSFGSFQVDPRTGEILHGVARIDSHRRRTTARMWENLQIPRSLLSCSAADAPEYSWIAAGGLSPEIGEEELVLERLRYLVAHEVGHTLGLAHNWAATTFGWGSVMDYLAPNIQPRGDRLDLSDAYPRDIGPYDRLMIHWGYAASEDPENLDRLVRDAYAAGQVYPLESDPRWAEYDWGSDPVEWLRTTQEVRRILLRRFGQGQLARGEPVSDLQSRFSLVYLYHRFGIAAAQQFVGGQFQTNALEGDGQTPTQWVPASRQHRALELLIAALSPDNLEIPERIVESLVAAPSERPATHERFVSEAGQSFSPLSAARALAGLIVDPLFAPDRAARLTLASGPDALTLAEMIRRLTAGTWGAPAPESPGRAALARVAQRAVLDGLLELAARPDASPEVRSAVFARLRRLRAELRARRSPDAATEEHVRMAEADLAEFLDHPEARRPRPPRPAPPPGRPIGN